MQRPDLATLACINADCQQFGGTGQGHLTIRKVYGKDGIRLLRCGRCHEEFSERRNTALFNTKISEAKAEDVIDHLDEGCSVRATSRLTKTAKVTVARLLKVSGRHAQRFHDQQVKDLRPRAIQFDEPWSLVKKKQKHCSPEEVHQAGDFWDHTAIAPDSKLIVSLVVGKRTQEQTQALVSDTQSRLRKGYLPALFSDGYEGYEPAILATFGRRDAAPKTGLTGRPRLDLIRWPQGLAYGQGMSEDWPSSNRRKDNLAMGFISKGFVERPVSFIPYLCWAMRRSIPVVWSGIMARVACTINAK